MRRRRGQPVHGWIILDKPVGVGSTPAVAQVRRAFDAQKAGHGGTLDPLASGILPIALGEATKTVPYVMDGKKTYRFTVRFGEERTTDDAEGTCVEVSPQRPSRQDIDAVLPAFIGTIYQVPPQFSALRVDGKRSYERARQGEDVTLTPRPVWVESLSLETVDSSDEATFCVTTGKGFYVRALARDMGRRLGCFGYISALRRCACGPFSEEDAISLDKLQQLGHSSALLDALLPTASALDDIPAIAVSDDDAFRLSKGQMIPCHGPEGCAVVRAMKGDQVVALVRICDGAAHPFRVLNA